MLPSAATIVHPGSNHGVGAADTANAAWSAAVDAAMLYIASASALAITL